MVPPSVSVAWPEDSGESGLAPTKGSATSRSFLLLRDAIFAPLVVAWYLAQAKFAEEPSLLGAGAAEVSAAVLVLQALLAAVAAAVLLIDVLAPPPDPAEEGMVRVLSVLGRWVFLTRHCLALQLVHLALSLLAYAASMAWLQQLVEGMAVWIGALGWFVTIQFFLLVYGKPDFEARCVAWANRDPPYNLRIRAIVSHAPALVLAAFDVLLAKEHAVLRRNCSIVKTLLLSAAYALFYLALIAVNYAFTGCWPYAFMKEFTRRRWATFIVTQVAVLAVLCTAQWGLSRVPLP